MKIPQEREALYNKLVAELYERGKAINMASYLEIDAVIDPADTRKWIMQGLEIRFPPGAPGGPVTILSTRGETGKNNIRKAVERSNPICYFCIGTFLQNRKARAPWKRYG